MSKKPSLTDLAAKKPSPATVEAPAAAEPAAKKGKAGSQADGRKGVLIRIQPAGWRALRDVAAELTLQTGDAVTMQSLLTDAINELLKRHGRPPLA